jgi:hypothetical protein
MSEHVRTDGVDREEAGVPALPGETDPRDSVEAYETDEGTVLQDADEPLAWLQSSYAVRIEESR